MGDFIALMIFFLICCIVPIPIYYIIRKRFGELIRGE